jgi:hypothetical protein
MRLTFKIVLAATVVWMGLAWAGHAPKGDSLQMPRDRMCAQVIHCGVKNGKMKQYPTRCAAEDDRAKSIEPMQGPACPQRK